MKMHAASAQRVTLTAAAATATITGTTPVRPAVLPATGVARTTDMSAEIPDATIEAIAATGATTEATAVTVGTTEIAAMIVIAGGTTAALTTAGRTAERDPLTGLRAPQATTTARTAAPGVLHPLAAGVDTSAGEVQAAERCLAAVRPRARGGFRAGVPAASSSCEPSGVRTKTE